MVKQGYDSQQYLWSQDEIMLLIFLVSCVSILLYQIYGYLTRVTRRVSVVEKQLLPLSDHPSSPGF